MKVLSVVIPAYNESKSIAATLVSICQSLSAHDIDFEIVVVDDHSSDNTADVVELHALHWPQVRVVKNQRMNGFGNAIHTGLDAYTGDAVVIVMADASDEPRDIVTYWRKLQEGYDCVFGSRFTRGAQVVDYPAYKLALNRIGNSLISAVFGLRYNDMSNAFKAFRRETIDGVRPVLSHHFNITVELPLKAIVRGYSWTVVPTNWYNRKEGVSKFKIKEMGSRYLFIILYVLLEKLLSRGDYRMRQAPVSEPSQLLS